MKHKESSIYFSIPKNLISDFNKACEKVYEDGKDKIAREILNHINPLNKNEKQKTPEGKPYE